MLLSENEIKELNKTFGSYLINEFTNAIHSSDVKELTLSSGRTVKYLVDSGSVVVLRVNEVLLG